VIVDQPVAKLHGVRALVTGGTSGLGRAMAEALADAGATTVVTSRDPGRASDTARQLAGDALGIAMDVRDDGAVEAGVEHVYGELGGLDVLVNNAGVGMRRVNPRFLTEPQPFWAVAPAGFRDVVETKLTGSFLVARAVVPRMLEAGGGRVVTISMSKATTTRRGFVPYRPSGAGVEALAGVMAADLEATPVRANILLPGGATATGMVPDEVSDDVRAGLLDPSIMGPPIVWLASPRAAGVHGERIVAATFESWLASRQRAGESSR
jgi:gluconate 5-dehydrogenase